MSEVGKTCREKPRPLLPCSADGNLVMARCKQPTSFPSREINSSDRGLVGLQSGTCSSCITYSLLSVPEVWDHDLGNGRTPRSIRQTVQRCSARRDGMKETVIFSHL